MIARFDPDWRRRSEPRKVNQLVRVPTWALKSPAKIIVNFFWTKVRMRWREDKKSCCTCAAALALGAYAAMSANPVCGNMEVGGA